MDRDVNQDQTRQIAGNILIFLPGLVMGASAIAKFAHVPAVVHPMDACGFPDAKLTLVATLELLSAALFLLPRGSVWHCDTLKFSGACISVL
jgi:hypothetical protein